MVALQIDLSKVERMMLGDFYSLVSRPRVIEYGQKLVEPAYFSAYIEVPF